MERRFNEGDVVCLKSNTSMPMTIGLPLSGRLIDMIPANTYTCYWTTATGEPRAEVYHENMLAKYSPCRSFDVTPNFKDETIIIKDYQQLWNKIQNAFAMGVMSQHEARSDEYREAMIPTANKLGAEYADNELAWTKAVNKKMNAIKS